MPRTLPPLDALRALDAFARLGSVVRAAAELGITRSAVSHRIAKLEDCLGFDVLERSGKGVALTARGKRYAAGVREPLVLLTAAGETTKRMAIDGNLKISSTAGFASLWLCKHIAQFYENYPSLSVEIIIRRDLSDVSDPSSDVFIAFGDGNWPNFVVRKLYDVDFLPLCSPSLLSRRGGIERPADVLKFPLLHASRRDEWSRWFATNAVESPDPLPGIVFSDMMLVHAAAVAGQGIMLGDNFTCSGSLTTGELVCPFSTMTDAYGSYFLVVHRRKQAKPAVQAFSAWVDELIAWQHPDPIDLRGSRRRA